MPYNSFNEGSVESFKPGIHSKSTGETLRGFESLGTQQITGGNEMGSVLGSGGIGGVLGGAGSVMNAGASIYSAYHGVKQGKEALKLQREQLDLANKQFAAEQERYNKREAQIDAANENLKAAGQDFSTALDKQKNGTSDLPMNRI